MKNLLQYFLIAFVFSITISCSKDNSEVKPPENNNSYSFCDTCPSPTICDITGSSISTPDFSYVTPNTSTDYSYYNNGGVPDSIVWKIKSANPTGSIILTGNGTTIQATFRSDFIYGEITSFGIGNVNSCESLLKIYKK